MRKRILSIAVVVLLLLLICGIAHHNNDWSEEEMAEAYLNKIWVNSDWTGEYYDEISFCFLEFKDGECRGGMEPDKVCHLSKCFHMEEGLSGAEPRGRARVHFPQRGHLVRPAPLPGRRGRRNAAGVCGPKQL